MRAVTQAPQPSWLRAVIYHSLRVVIASVIKFVYRVEVRGLENYLSVKGPAILVANHTSFLDAPLLATCLPEDVTFAINSRVAEQWWVRPWLRLVKTFRIDPASPLATKSLIRTVRDGRNCVIFPEGRITVTGALMKIYEGPGMVADRTGAAVVPVRIDGAQYTPFSRLRGKVRIRLFPKIKISVLEPRRFEIPDEARGRIRRQIAAAQLYDLMSDMMFRTSDRSLTLFEALLDARDTHHRKAVILEDVATGPMSYGRLVIGSLVLGRRIADMTEPREHVGVMLPNAVGAAVTFLALQAYGRVPAMLNFTAGPANIAAACRAAEVRTVLTARAFIERARLETLIEALNKTVRVVYLEDIRAELGLADKLRGLAAARVARLGYRKYAGKPHDPAVILFTSGSEGAPKGVVLSHMNILANCRQLAARIDFNPADLVFNALPVFHAFGLTGGLILPLLWGVRTFLYPSPLHYRIVPELAYASNATIMFGTDTFLSGYARTAHPYDFYSLRYAFAGAEKLREETSRSWMEKFGVRILEGYGATECAPGLAVNTPMHFRAGTVGRLLPGIEYRVTPVEGIEIGGRLHVSGPNVMLGYLRPDRPGEIDPVPAGWYDTGDIVEVDAQGFVRILGRAKRFAKVAGEMVSLAAAEALASAVWPEGEHAVIAVPDGRRGERLILATDRKEVDPASLSAHARAQGLPEFLVPKQIVTLDTLPVLGSGKYDYVAIRDRLAEATDGVPKSDQPSGGP